MEKDFNFACVKDLENDVKFYKEVFPEFKIYKEKSLPHEHSAPSIHVQKTYQSIHDLFGRDRLETVDKIARKEDVRHLHIYSIGLPWFIDDNELLAQWFCTSDTQLIYSYFFHKNTHYYYVIDFLDLKAHNRYANEVFKQECIVKAINYRKSIMD